MGTGRILVAALAVLCLLAGVTTPLQSAAAGNVDEGQIAYLHSDGNIYVFDLSTRQATQITTRSGISNFAWSPDGKQIAIQTNSGGSSDIYTMNADGTNIEPIANTSDDESTPAYDRSGSLYYVQHTTEPDRITNRVTVSNIPEQDQEVYQEPGGLCHITNLSFSANRLMAVSRNCGRGKNVSIIQPGTNAEVYIGKDSCVMNGVWSYTGDRLAAVQTDCAFEGVTAKITIFNRAGQLASSFGTPDDGSGSIDWAARDMPIVYGNENGLWLVADEGKAIKISEQGGVPRWKPTAPQVPPQPITDSEGPEGMPRAGNTQMVDDLLAAGALTACIAIGSGLFIIARKRRKDGDGL